MTCHHHPLADRRASSVVEFALILPLVGCLLFGILGYGQYFLLAHLVQQLANDAARATVAGLSTTERATLAQQSVATEAASLSTIDSARLTTSTSEANGYVTVTVSYDASSIAILRTRLAPMPDAVIRRRAVVRNGGVA